MLIFLLNLVVLTTAQGNDILACNSANTFDFSSDPLGVTFESHPEGDGFVSFYPSHVDQDCTWKFTLGSQCAKVDFYCDFMMLPEDTNQQGSCIHYLEIDNDKYNV